MARQLSNGFERRNEMKTGAAIGLGVVAVAAIAFGVYMVDLDVTEEGAMPDVDVSVEGGNLPEVDADFGEVVVGTTEETVDVPDVDVEVDTREAEVQVPTVGVNPPEDN